MWIQDGGMNCKSRVPKSYFRKISPLVLMFLERCGLLWSYLRAWGEEKGLLMEEKARRRLRKFSKRIKKTLRKCQLRQGELIWNLELTGWRGSCFWGHLALFIVSCFNYSLMWLTEFERNLIFRKYFHDLSLGYAYFIVVRGMNSKEKI